MNVHLVSPERERASGPQGELETVIAEALDDLWAEQRGDGHWVFELEADVTIPAEYIMLNHFVGEPDPPLEADLAHYIRERQGEDGGWPLFYAGDADISATVKAYLALRLAGDAAQAPHMRRARERVLALGGAERCNVFTLYSLALYGEVPWTAVPVMPVEMVLQPAWSPFSIWRMSYWSRTVVVPLLVVAALRPKARNPEGVVIPELFRSDPSGLRGHLRNPTGRPLGYVFLALDKVLRPLEARVPKRLRDRAIARALDFIRPRLNGEDGIGAIFPAMANVVMALHALGRPADDPEYRTAKRAVDHLITGPKDRRYCQPCFSPVWDTALTLHTVMEGGGRAEAAERWLVERQVTDFVGDWAVQRPEARPGGWPFQYANPHYPDLDDTAVIAMALHRADPERHSPAIARATAWLLALQSRNGGWASFDADNTAFHLNHIPFADHGALLDPPTADVTARVLGLLGQLGWRQGQAPVDRALAFLTREQEADGSWFGRWGTNYIYGTWSVLSALNAIGVPPEDHRVRAAVAWLLDRQREDGGWGEDGATYFPDRRHLVKASTASQTAWALLALMAAGEVANPAAARGVRFLLDHPREGCRWEEPWYTAVGFPRVFYLRYHGYARYFPIWALARYRNLTAAGRRDVAYGL